MIIPALITKSVVYLGTATPVLRHLLVLTSLDQLIFIDLLFTFLQNKLP